MEKNKFYLLRDKCLGLFVSHVSITAFGCLVSCTGDWIAGILLTYDQAELFVKYLVEHQEECYGYELVEFGSDS